jgi:hypothetical protein
MKMDLNKNTLVAFFYVLFILSLLLCSLLVDNFIIRTSLLACFMSGLSVCLYRFHKARMHEVKQEANRLLAEKDK